MCDRCIVVISVCGGSALAAIVAAKVIRMIVDRRKARAGLRRAALIIKRVGEMVE